MSIQPYKPDLKKIKNHCKNPHPLILTDSEYQNLLQEYQLVAGARLSDVGILKCMEAGLIKVIDEEGVFDLLEQIKCSSLDLRLGHEFWFYQQHKISRLTMGSHKEHIEQLDLLAYNYKATGDVFLFHPETLVLTMTQELLSLSSVIVGQFDGKSSAGRLGLSNHQTAGQIQPGFAGPIVMEISNTNYLDIAVPVHQTIGSIAFYLLDQPSSRPEALATTSLSKAFMQKAPFGYRKAEWDKEKKRIIKLGADSYKKGYELSGDPAKLK